MNGSKTRLNNIAVDRSFTITSNVITDGVLENRAIGGSIWLGQTYWVGEQGPELITLLCDQEVVNRGRDQRLE